MNDGSTLSNLQVVLNPDSTEGYDLITDAKIHTGAAVTVVGELVASIGGKQKVRCANCSLCTGVWLFFFSGNQLHGAITSKVFGPNNARQIEGAVSAWLFSYQQRSELT